MRSFLRLFMLTAAFLAAACSTKAPSAVDETGHKNFGGIYPHLAYYNSQRECGTGAVVPWQGDLWVVTYGPHEPYGSDDKLYQITPGLDEIVRPESIGGTPADRMIHDASNQLFIGPYAIDADKNVRVLSYEKFPGRPTGLAAHLTDPDNRILYASMEAGFYDIDVHTLDGIELYKDGNQKRKEGFTVSPFIPITEKKENLRRSSSISLQERLSSGMARIGNSSDATSSLRSPARAEYMEIHLRRLIPSGRSAGTTVR